jgi:carbon storage regulator CsrA
MLILTRQIDEKLRIGEEVSVTVISVSGQQVRLGIQAPRSVPVHREEVFRRISAERTQLPESPPIAEKDCAGLDL